MNLWPIKMTRRKQNAPKRLKSTAKAGGDVTNETLADTSHVTSDSGADEGEEDGETTSDEENTEDKAGNSDRASSRTPDSIVNSDLPREAAETADKKNDEPQGEVSTGKKREKQGRGRSQLEERVPWTPHLPMSTPSAGSNANKFKYSSKISTPLLSPSQRLSLPILDQQMALVMSTMPLALLSRGKNSSSPLDSSLSYFPVASSHHTEEQPLDLSTKTEKSSPPLDKPHLHDPPKLHDPPRSNSSNTSNGISSLQSLQQRFGGDFPLELSQKPGPAVIPLQSSLSHKANTTPHTSTSISDSLLRASAAKSKNNCRSDWLERQELLCSRLAASPPSSKGDNSRQSSPSLVDEPGSDAKHTIHRCSCQKTFNTLYALSLHLQETGHAPGSSKAASLMDYPKLVRGQDMWLNQESEQTRRILRCMQCGESFKSLPLLTVHMMQTQHYTKIVSSDHGRRSHKCSTYCDRELDKECIFKCKVCHEAFPDMEGLANHMIISGHHKKQSSRQNQLTSASMFAEVAGGLASIARQGRRKRYLPDDAALLSSASSSTVASLLEYRRKQACANGDLNGFHPDQKGSPQARSPDARPAKLVLCDSCGKRVDIQDFDSHVRACLKQRAEVIDALKLKLAAEEAILSRSESKLLRSGFSLSSVPRLHEDLYPVPSSSSKETLPTPSETKFSEERAPSDEIHPAVKSELPSPDRNVQPSPVAQLSDNSPQTAKICDLVEVPLKKWYCSSEPTSQQEPTEEEPDSNKHQQKPQPVDSSKHQEKPQPVVKKEEPPAEDRRTPSPLCPRKRKLSSSNQEKTPADSHQRCDTNLVTDTFDESLDFQSSALHKLDMFSRGLRFSPPRRNLSPEPKLPTHTAQRASRKKESSTSGNRKEFSKSPAPISPASSHLKTDSPETPKKEVTFDIIDPNAVADHSETKSSALEAMESFIQKSFSAKSDLRTSNLASMFSPFRNCFPLPGTLPGQGGVLPDVTDPAMSHFAKFSKFFRMVPGVSSFPDVSPPVLHEGLLSTSAPVDQKKSAALDKAAFYAKKMPNKSCSTSSMPSAIKVPVVKLPQDSPLHSPHDISAVKRLSENVSAKKYKYSTMICNDVSNVSAKQKSGKLTGTGSAYKNMSDFSKEELRLPSSSEWERLREEMLKKRKTNSEEEDSSSDPKKVNIKEEKVDAISNVKVKVEQCSDDEIDDGNDDRSDPDGKKLSAVQTGKTFIDNFLFTPGQRGDDVPSPGHVPKNADPKTSSGLPQSKDDRPTLDEGSDSRQTTAQPGHRIKDGDRLTPRLMNEHTDRISPQFLETKDQSGNLDQENFGSKRASSSSKSQMKSCNSSIEEGSIAGGENLNNSSPSFSKESERSEEVLNTKVKIKCEVENDEVEFDKKCLKSPGQSKNEAEAASVQENDVKPVLTAVNHEDSCGGEEEEMEMGEITKKHSHSFGASFNGRAADGRKSGRLKSGSPAGGGGDRRRSRSPLLGGHKRRSRTPDGGAKRSRSPAGGRDKRSPAPSPARSASERNGHSESPSEQKQKRSALDSLSSFVYSQPLTSEHPLDSLQRLLSTNDLTHLQHDPHKHLASASYKCLTPDLSTPLNLTMKGSGVASGGCSSDDNDEGDSNLAEGGASEGEVSEYKCAACNRRFASKGSYRYHLSRCHLSSVKKFGIKEAFNMSPYVYLPLDHTAKFSKYYQMAHELANKGK
ncbi:uncharacterized protein LOC131937175 [Physella acuta]|uniref:uncharacterized protein LOC131937175 n=1 Tax=Physella acuta TaxID=109671 RepID=UPI0027DCC338|nr:uncharacterized protein LOC131937175 [Physella acuta]